MKIYNTASRKKEIFTSINKKQVTIYVCGVTPYDTTHLGHAFTYVSFDALIRYLKYKGYEVNYTQNVTDIDDDVLRKAKETNRDWIELGNFWTNKFLNDLNFPPTFGILLKPVRRIGEEKVASVITFPIKLSIIFVEQTES